MGSVIPLKKSANSAYLDLKNNLGNKLSKVENLIGVTKIEAGIENSHFIYGKKKTCKSEVISIEVKPAPKPEIIFGNQEMTIITPEKNIEWDVDGIELINSNNIKFMINIF